VSRRHRIVSKQRLVELKSELPFISYKQLKRADEESRGNGVKIRWTVLTVTRLGVKKEGRFGKRR
jgi:hypothetical protein